MWKVCVCEVGITTQIHQILPSHSTVIVRCLVWFCRCFQYISFVGRQYDALHNKVGYKKVFLKSSRSSFSQKNCMKMKNIGLRRGRAFLAPPLDPPMAIARNSQSVADIHSQILDARPLGVHILSISCCLWENLAKSYVGAPGGLLPPPWGNS